MIIREDQNKMRFVTVTQKLHKYLKHITSCYILQTKVCSETLEEIQYLPGSYSSFTNETQFLEFEQSVTDRYKT